MKYKQQITVYELRKSLEQLDQDAIIDLGGDEEINTCGPIAMHKNGSLDVVVDVHADTGATVYILWPPLVETPMERYVCADI